MKNLHRTHRWLQAVVLTLLVGIIWEGAGADLAFQNAAVGTFLPKSNPLLRLPGFDLERPLTLGDRRRATPLTEVRIRLFTSRKIRFLTVDSPSGLIISGKRLQRKAKFSVYQGKIQLADGSRVIARSTSFTIRPQRQGLLMASLGTPQSRSTRGEMRLTLYKGQILVINQLRLEDYLPGIVEPELGSLNVGAEAMKSQMIAGRSYLLSLRERHRREGYEFCDSPHCQAFTGIPKDSPRLTQAAKETSGLYLTYKGKTVTAFYHHSCGGTTASYSDIWPGGPRRYLTRVKDGEPAYCRHDRKASWVFKRSPQALEGAFKRLGWIRPSQSISEVKVLRTDPHGRALSVLLTTKDQRIVLDAGAFRRGLNRFFGQELIYSTAFTLTREPATYIFKGRGWGHGVGLCQMGAMEMARQGKTYQQILMHYYPGTHLAKLSD